MIIQQKGLYTMEGHDVSPRSETQDLVEGVEKVVCPECCMVDYVMRGTGSCICDCCGAEFPVL